MKQKTFLSLALVGTVASGLMASVSTSSDQLDFFDGLSGTAVHDGFEAYGVDNQAGARTISFDGYQATYSGAALFGVEDSVNVAAGMAATDGERYLQVNFGGVTAVSLTFTFDQALSDFGVMIRDLELKELIYETNSGLSGVAFEAAGNNVAQFFGISTGGNDLLKFTEITFTMEARVHATVDAMLFDQLTTVVPAPGVLGLIGLGGLLMGYRRR